MKKLLLVTVLASAVASTMFAQPSLSFQANAHPIQYATPLSSPGSITTALAPVSGIPGFGQVNIGCYAVPAGTPLGSLFYGLPDLTSWHLGTPLVHVGPFDGYANQTVTFDSSLGTGYTTHLELEVVAWTGNYASFADALASGNALVAWTGSPQSGGGSGWDQLMGNVTTKPPVPPQRIDYGPTAFEGLILSAPDLQIVPEPSTFALAGLSLAALSLCRKHTGRH